MAAQAISVFIELPGDRFSAANHIEYTLPFVARSHDLFEGNPSSKGDSILIDIDMTMRGSKNSRIHGEDMNAASFNPFLEKERLFFLGIESRNQ
jgi:hypothetical protein